MSIADILSGVKREMPKLIGLKFNGTVGIVKTEDGWKVTVELLEKESIPDSMDILGLYEVNLDKEGAIFSFERKALRKRIDVETSSL